ncbi:MAG: bifunctional 5,10-methylene-tetrahydrofolate dehydrogenase/5,10-methylene-tetrahydrofolate cyclohydrolase [Clostridia bacterium]|nr:bifunctional 5,10-methylene-tetrahydrofolate dehydrogenase/5,10-methylene-tetrahydrofolate cyclohydrolase [Clostridia bacterium]
MAELLKGAPVASGITQDLKDRADALKAKGIVPTLAVLRVGEKADDLSYEKGIFSRCAKAGIEIKHIVLAENASKEEILGEIRKINEDSAIHGCLMFRPLADKETEAEAVKLLAPEKDMDAMTPSSMATVFLGTGDGYAPCTAQSCIEILKHYGVILTGANVVVVGRSPVIGKPVSMLLQKENATVTMCHTKTVSMAEICRKADVLVVAAGKAGVVDSDFVREGQVVIDVGINVDAEGKLCGDVDFASVEPVVKAITPVPGGVGSVTTSILASHLIEAAEKCAK